MIIKPSDKVLYTYSLNGPSVHWSGNLILFDSLDEAITIAQTTRKEWNSAHPENKISRHYLISCYNTETLKLLDDTEKHTDFGNDAAFCQRLKALGYDGYCFKEPSHHYLAYCIFDPQKMSLPRLMGK